MSPRNISIDEAMTLAGQSVIDGDVDAARRMYPKVLNSAPGHEAAKRALKDLLKSPRGSSDSESDFQRDMELLMSFYSTGMHEQALSEALLMQDKYPRQPMPLNVRGGVLLAQGQFDDAVSVLRAAYDLAPDYDSVLRNLGKALIRTGKSEEAAVCFEKALTINANDATALGYLGTALIDLKRVSEAKSCFQRSLALQPGDADVQHMYAELLRSEGHNKDALTHLRKTLELEPARLPAQIDLAHTLIDLKRYAAALKELSKTIDENPESADAQYYIGMAHFYLGDEALAGSAFKACIDLDPGYVPAIHFLAVVDGVIGDAVPKKYVTNIFDGYAGRFERALVDGLGYDGPKVLRSLFDQAKAPAENDTLDLGCGTGLCGIEFGDVSKNLVGIDLSANMLEVAEGKNLYNRLICGDIVDTLEAEDHCYSLFLAADMLVYVGWLERFFTAVCNRSTSNAWFVFSTENLEAGDVQLRSSGRYAHSHEYVQKVADAVGFEVVEFHRAPLRKESDGWIEGGYYLLQLR